MMEKQFQIIWGANQYQNQSRIIRHLFPIVYIGMVFLESTLVCELHLLVVDFFCIFVVVQIGITSLFASFFGKTSSNFSGLDLSYKSDRFYFIDFQCPSIIVAGRKDVVVPFDIVTSFYECAVAACSTDHQSESVKLLELPDSDHFAMVDVSSSHWQQVFNAIELAMK